MTWLTRVTHAFDLLGPFFYSIPLSIWPPVHWPWLLLWAGLLGLLIATRPRHSERNVRVLWALPPLWIINGILGGIFQQQFPPAQHPAVPGADVAGIFVIGNFVLGVVLAVGFVVWLKKVRRFAIVSGLTNTLLNFMMTVGAGQAISGASF